MSTDSTQSETTGPSLSEVEQEVPWVRSTKTLPENRPEDVAIDTNISVVERGVHVATLENLGYRVERIGFDPPYGCRFYCLRR